MYRGIIIYAPAEESLDQLVRRLADCFDGERFKVEIKTADQIAIPDLTGADLFLLGTLPAGEKAIHPDFTEVLRALDGITLAGRVAGAFSVDSEPSVAAFRRALQDCELVLSEQNFRNLSGDRLGSSDLRDWVAALTRQLEQQDRGR